MSKLSVTLRKDGLGSLVDAFDGLENTVINSAQTEGQQVVDTTVEGLGSAAATAVASVASKYTGPAGGALAGEVVNPFLAGLEHFAENFFANFTHHLKPATPPQGG